MDMYTPLRTSTPETAKKINHEPVQNFHIVRQHHYRVL